MAGSLLPPVIATLVADTKQFSAEMGKARQNMEATSKQGSGSFQKLAEFGKVAFTAISGAAIGLGVEAIHMADAFEGAHSRLESAIKNSGSSFDQWKTQIDDAGKSMEKLGFTNTQTQDALATLTNATHDEGRALKDVALAADLARGRHIELSAATAIIAKVETGRVSVLAKLGVATKTATGATISQEEALKRLSALYGGNASAYAQTFAGKMDVLKASVTNLATQLGLWLIPKVEQVASALSSVIHWLNENRAAADALAVVVGGPLVVAMSAFLALKVQAALEGIAGAWDLVTSGAGLFGGTADGIAAVGNATSTASEALTQLSTDANTAATAAGAVTSAMGVTKTASTAAAVATSAEAAATAEATTFHWLGVAALEGEAVAAAESASALAGLTTAELAAAAAAETRAAAEAAAAATGVLDSAAGGAGGIGVVAGGISALGPAALIAIPTLALLGWTIWDDGQKAKQAKAELADFLRGSADLATRSSDPVHSLGQQIRQQGTEIGRTYQQIQDIKDRANTQDFRYSSEQRQRDARSLVDLERKYSLEKKQLGGLQEQYKKADDTITQSKQKAAAEQSAAAAKAIEKEKQAVRDGLEQIAGLYGRFNSDRLKAEGFGSKQLDEIGKKISGIISKTDGAIRSFGDVLGAFNDKTKVTGKNVINFLQGTVTKTRQWQGDIQKLIKDGIDRGLIEQLIAAGPSSEKEVKGILDGVSKGGKDTINVAIAQQRDLINSTNQLLANQVVAGETVWRHAQSFYSTHPLVSDVIIGLSGAGAPYLRSGHGGQQSSQTPLVKQHAAGGLIGEGRWSVAENMAELVEPSGLVHSGADTARMLAGGKSGGVVVNIDARGTVGLDLDALGRVTYEALHRYGKNNGGLRLAIKT